MSDYAFAVDAKVLELFSQCSKRERDELLRIFDSLAGQRCKGEISVKRMLLDEICK
jgi:hypothetical protein